MTPFSNQKNPSREGDDYTSSHQRGCFRAFSYFNPPCLYGVGATTPSQVLPVRKHLSQARGKNRGKVPPASR